MPSQGRQSVAKTRAGCGHARGETKKEEIDAAMIGAKRC
jgi:hypothetical protein